MSGNIGFQLHDLDRQGHTTTDTVAMVTSSSPATSTATEKETKSEEESGGVRGLLALYGTSASIHGLSQIGGPALYGFRRWIWVILVLGMSMGLAVILFKQVKRLSSYPTRTTVRPEFQDELEFPAVTICNLNQFYRDRVPDDPDVQHLIKVMSEWTYLAKDNPNTTTTTTPNPEQSDKNNRTSISGDELRSIIWHTAHRKSEFLYKCMWRSRYVSCDDVFETRMTDLGVCFTFNGNLSKELRTSPMAGLWMGLRVVAVLDQNQYYFSRTVQTGVKITLHEPGHEPMPDTSGLLLRPGVSAVVAVKKQVESGLPYPYKAYGDSYCLDTEAADFNRTLHRYSFYSQTACLRDCLLAVAEDRCGCANPFEIDTRRPIPFCSVDQMLSCYLHVTGNFTFEDLHACDCQPPCKRVKYDVTTSYADFASDFMELQLKPENGDGKEEFLSRNVVDVRVFVESLMVVHVQQEPEMTLLDVLGTLGGHLGLCLGASLLSITELTEMLLLLVLRFLAWLRGRPERKQTSSTDNSGQRDRGSTNTLSHSYQSSDRSSGRNWEQHL